MRLRYLDWVLSYIWQQSDISLLMVRLVSLGLTVLTWLQKLRRLRCYLRISCHGFVDFKNLLPFGSFSEVPTWLYLPVQHRAYTICLH